MRRFGNMVLGYFRIFVDIGRRDCRTYHWNPQVGKKKYGHPYVLGLRRFYRCMSLDLSDLGTISILGGTTRLHCGSQYGILFPIHVR